MNCLSEARPSVTARALQTTHTRRRASTGKMQRAVWSLSRKFVFKLRPPAAMPESMESFPWAAQRAAPRMVHLKPVVPLCDRELLGWLAQLGVQTLTRISEEEVALEAEGGRHVKATARIISHFRHQGHTNILRHLPGPFWDSCWLSETCSAQIWTRNQVPSWGPGVEPAHH